MFLPQLYCSFCKKALSQLQVHFQTTGRIMSYCSGSCPQVLCTCVLNHPRFVLCRTGYIVLLVYVIAIIYNAKYVVNRGSCFSQYIDSTSCLRVMRNLEENLIQNCVVGVTAL